MSDFRVQPTARNSCPTCGEVNAESEDFCVTCGKPLVTCVCPSCFSENPPRTHSCQVCSRPLDYIAFCDPIRSIQSSAWLLGEINRKANKGRIGTLLKWGVILGFGPISVLATICIINGLWELTWRGGIGVAHVIASIPVFIVYVCVFLNVLRAVFRHDGDLSPGPSI